MKIIKTREGLSNFNNSGMMLDNSIILIFTLIDFLNSIWILEKEMQTMNLKKFELERAYTNQINDVDKLQRPHTGKTKRPQTGNLSLKSRNFNIGGSYHKSYMFNNSAWSKDR